MFYYDLVPLGLASKKEVFTFYSSNVLDIGFVVKSRFKSKIIDFVVYKMANKPEFECNEILEICDFGYSSFQIGLAEFISSYYICSLGQAFGLMYPYQKNSSMIENPFLKENKIKLSKEQILVFDDIKKHKQALLFGDTGSGKTEIYISMIYEILKQNKTTLFLMPEISLTPQMQKRLEHHFGDLVAIWHSKVSPKQKKDILNGIYSKKIKIIAGARSALFLPIHDLGLIVVDEEHDESYKSNSTPRYNARDLSIYIAKKLSINIILGSATPSLSSTFLLPVVRLKQTFHESSKSIYFENSTDDVTPFMLELLKATLSKRKQAIVFLPTRANFKYVFCSSCGEKFLCPYCSVSMSLHQNKGVLKCHHCNFCEPIPKECPKCLNTDLITQRLGTSEVVDVLKKHFPNHVIEKFDRDSISTQKQLKDSIEAFNKHKIDILVGTQMLSKGHDYHNVDLSLILGIDSLLFMPDFRARERALSLAIQVAGRAGRKGEGRVFVQTNQREFFETFMRDYDLFLKEECKFRAGLYPPFSRLMRVVVSHKSQTKAHELTQDFIDKFNSCKTSVELVGYSEAPIQKLNDKYRYNILLRCKEHLPLIKTWHLCKVENAVVDMDPFSFF